MRYDTTVWFVKETPGAYDATTGNYADPASEAVAEYASVTDTGLDTLHLVYGEIRQGVKTVRIQGHHEEPFDYILIGGVRYHVDKRRTLRTKETFIVSSEVQ